MRKFSIKKNVAQALELPPEYVQSSIKLTLYDFSRLQILNYKSIIEYTEERIRINTKDKIIKITGEGLNIDNITDDEIGISGKILSFEFE